MSSYNVIWPPSVSRSVAPLVTIVVLLVGVGAFLGFGGQPAAAASDTDTLVGHGGQCLDVPYRNAVDGQDLWMWDCNGTEAQEWTIEDGRLKVMGKCLDIEGPSLQKGAIAQIWECQDVPQHLWRLTAEGQIISTFSGLCLDVAFGNTERGAAVHLWACNDTPPQHWELRSVESATPTASSDRNRLDAGDELASGQRLTSPNGEYELHMQAGDSNLVVYRVSDYAPIWSSSSGGAGGGKLVMQADGNLVIYRSHEPIWASHTNTSGSVLILQNDGAVAIYSQHGLVWANGERYSPTTSQASGDYPTSPVPQAETVVVRGFRVHPSLATNLEGLLAAADAEGITLGGWGWRSHERQIELRKQHCGGSTHYHIYEKPSSQCSPPTARPGVSRHERGTAIDFTDAGRSMTRRSAAFRFLERTAPRLVCATCRRNRGTGRLTVASRGVGETRLDTSDAKVASGHTQGRCRRRIGHRGAQAGRQPEPQARDPFGPSLSIF